jgi:NAD(P)H-nitrite reductase large subunit
VAANHLAQFGIGRYTGSLTSTKLKVTGIDLFSAGEFMGGEGTEEIVMSDPFGGVYKKLVIKDDKLVGACLYGDTVDGSYYFKLLRDGPQDRRHPRQADVRRVQPGRRRPRGPEQGRAMADATRSAAATASTRARSARPSRKRACSRWTRCASTPRPAPLRLLHRAWSSRS